MAAKFLELKRKYLDNNFIQQQFFIGDLCIFMILMWQIGYCYKKKVQWISPLTQIIKFKKKRQRSVKRIILRWNLPCSGFHSTKGNHSLELERVGVWYYLDLIKFVCKVPKTWWISVPTENNYEDKHLFKLYKRISRKIK